MEKIEPISKEQIKFLIRDCRAIIKQHMKDNSMSIHAFAKICGIHPAQLHLFLDNKRGLNLTTMQKIADKIS